MTDQYAFWKNELSTLSSLISEVIMKINSKNQNAPDFPICITGIPSYERNYAVELVVKEKGFDYCLISCSSRSTTRSLLFDLCVHLSVLLFKNHVFMTQRFLNVSYTFKSTGELLLDVQDYADKYAEQHNHEKNFYCIFDNVHNFFFLISLV